jgi:iduronate 2-sulfatase
LIILPPKGDATGRFATDAACDNPVSLIDLYPTLLDLCGLPEGRKLAGQSLRPLLEKPADKSKRLVVTTFDKGNHALSGIRWRYIRYKDGSEELYNRKNDPHEWTNLAAEAKNVPVRKRFAKALDEILTKGESK